MNDPDKNDIGKYKIFVIPIAAIAVFDIEAMNTPIDTDRIKIGIMNAKEGHKFAENATLQFISFIVPILIPAHSNTQNTEKNAHSD